MKISEIKDILKARVLAGQDQLDLSVFAAGGADLMDDVLAAVARDAVLLTGQTSENMLRTALVSGVSLVVLVRGKQPEARVIELAQSHNLPLLATDYSLFVACGRLYMAGLRGLDGSW